jgi:hypothetical protein
LQDGEGLESECTDNEVTINILYGENIWTVVKRKKKRKRKDNLSGKWNKQQKLNFECFGDIWYEQPYIYYHVTDTRPLVVNLPQQQQVQQQQPQQAQ